MRGLLSLLVLVTQQQQRGPSPVNNLYGNYRCSGWLDLLGVDQDGRLVVFELKKGTLPRDAVTQIIDYCSYLESLEAPDLARLISEQSGNLGIAKIEDFEEWYSSVSGKSPDDLRPVRMVLVGLGVDDSASRMVSFLANGCIEISLLTFHGYQHNGETLLARQAPRTDAGAVKPPPKSPGDRERALADRADSLGIGEPWRDAVDIFTQLGNYNQSPLTDGISFSLPAATTARRSCQLLWLSFFALQPKRGVAHHLLSGSR